MSQSLCPLLISHLATGIIRQLKVCKASRGQSSFP